MITCPTERRIYAIAKTNETGAKAWWETEDREIIRGIYAQEVLSTMPGDF